MLVRRIRDDVSEQPAEKSIIEYGIDDPLTFFRARDHLLRLPSLPDRINRISAAPRRRPKLHPRR